MNIKRINVLKNILLGGGLIAALLFFLSLKTFAEIIYENDEYKIKIYNYFDPFEKTKKNESVSFVDFNKDGKDEKIVLKQNIVRIFSDEKIIFETENEWFVDEVITGDFNNDGKTDLGLYLWKTGSYGTSKPFWVKENDTSYKQHLFLYDWDDRENKIAPLWHSSNLPYINAKTILDDIDGDGNNELIVLEKPYDYYPWQCSKNIAVWRWNQWGFENIWRSEDGKFDDLFISK